MRSPFRLLALVLALAASVQLTAGALPPHGEGGHAAPAHQHGHHGEDGKNCHPGPAPAPSPCDTGSPDCALMTGCYSTGAAAPVTAAEYPRPVVILSFRTPDTGHAQYAPVPDSPPPRA